MNRYKTVFSALHVINMEIDLNIPFINMKLEYFDNIKATFFFSKIDSCWARATLEVAFSAVKALLENFTLDLIAGSVSLAHVIKFNPTVGGPSSCLEICCVCIRMRV